MSEADDLPGECPVCGRSYEHARVDDKPTQLREDAEQCKQSIEDGPATIHRYRTFVHFPENHAEDDGDD